MSRIKAKDTKPELIVRRFLHQNGFRYRLHVKRLPGKPDIVLKKYETIVQVQGCFWHAHPGCKDSHIPKSRESYWAAKIQRNAERDKENLKRLENMGWKVIIVWECEIKSEEKRKNRLHLLEDEILFISP